VSNAHKPKEWFEVAAPGAGVVVPALDGEAVPSVEGDEVAIVDGIELGLTDCPVVTPAATELPDDA
jgi:hypothetical protein